MINILTWLVHFDKPAQIWVHPSRGIVDESRPTTLRRDLEVMETETQRLQAMIDDLFTLAQLEADLLTLQTDPTDVVRVVERVVDATTPPAWLSSRVRVVAEAPSDGPRVLADERRFEQVSGNLWQIGVRHTQPGRIVAVMVTPEEQASVGSCFTVRLTQNRAGFRPRHSPC